MDSYGSQCTTCSGLAANEKLTVPRVTGRDSATLVTSSIPSHRIPMRTSLRRVLLLAAVAGCHRAPVASSAPVAQAAPPAVRISEGNIVAIILAANNTDLSYARLAPSRARSAAVKTFAQRMTTDHTI